MVGGTSCFFGGDLIGCPFLLCIPYSPVLLFSYFLFSHATVVIFNCCPMSCYLVPMFHASVFIFYRSWFLLFFMFYSSLVLLFYTFTAFPCYLSHILNDPMLKLAYISALTSHCSPNLLLTSIILLQCYCSPV